MDLSNLSKEDILALQQVLANSQATPKVDFEEGDELSLEMYDFLKGMNSLDKKTSKIISTKPFSEKLKNHLIEELSSLGFYGDNLYDANSNDITSPKLTKNKIAKSQEIRLFLGIKSSNIFKLIAEDVYECINHFSNFVVNPKKKPKWGEFNLYQQNEIKQIDEEIKGFPHIKLLLDNVFGVENFDLACSWIKSGLDYRFHDKVPVIVSKQGIGKGFFASHVLEALTHNSRVIEDVASVVLDKFNSQLMNKSFVLINEIEKSEFSKFMSKMKQITGSTKFTTEIKFGGNPRLNRIQQYMIFTNKTGIENYNEEEQRRFILIDRMESSPLITVVKEKLGIRMEDFEGEVMKELFNFKEHLRSYKGNLVEITELSKDIINSKENKGQLFLKALGTNDYDLLFESLHGTIFGTDNSVNTLIKHNEKGLPFSTSLINVIMKTIQPTFVNNQQLKKKPYIDTINEYFNIESQKKDALKYAGKTDIFNICDGTTKNVIRVNDLLVNEELEINDDNGDIWE